MAIITYADILYEMSFCLEGDCNLVCIDKIETKTLDLRDFVFIHDNTKNKLKDFRKIKRMLRKLFDEDTYQTQFIIVDRDKDNIAPSLVERKALQIIFK